MLNQLRAANEGEKQPVPLVLASSNLLTYSIREYKSGGEICLCAGALEMGSAVCSGVCVTVCEVGLSAWCTGQTWVSAQQCLHFLTTFICGVEASNVGATLSVLLTQSM
jgi:hypothetical protein